VKPVYTHDVLRERIYSRVWPSVTRTNMTPEQILDVQWGHWFVEKMQQRMIVGFFRYGPLREARAKGIRRDHIKSIIKHLRSYLKTGNQEHLVDAANLCMVEAALNPSCHPAPYFRSIDDGEHTEDL